MHVRALVLVMLASAAAGPLQQPPPPRFRADVDAVRVDVLVTRGGRPVGGLTASDFELLDDGVLQRVEFVNVETVPVNVVLALDSSDSVAGERLSALIDAGRAAVGALRPIDRAAILTFSHEITERVALTGDRERLVSELSRLTAAGNTSLYDATYAGLLLREIDQSRTVLLIFSDGQDTSSWLVPSAVLEAAARSDVVVYAVAVEAPAAERPVDPLIRNPHRKRPVDVLKRRGRSAFLDEITASTGGRLLRPHQRDLSRRFVHVLKEFQNRYLLTYLPSSVKARGWHDVTVRVKRSGVQVRARRGYWR